MHDAHSPHAGPEAAADAGVVVDPLDRALRTLHGVLPDQAPIGVFVHHNTLHALQHLPFEQAVQEGAALLGARPWPAMTTLRDAWRRGRFADRDVDAELAALDAREAPGSHPVALPLGLTRRTLRMALLRDDLDVDDDDDDHDGGAGAAFAAGADARFARARALAETLPPRAAPTSASTPATSLPSTSLPATSLPATSLPSTSLPSTTRRHRDALLALGAGDLDDVVHPELVRLGLSFLDLGQAPVRLPGRERGFLKAAAAALAQSPPRGAPGLRDDVERVLRDGLSARAVALEVLKDLGLDDDPAVDWLVATGLALRGVAGMFSRFERHPEEADAPATLLEFLAVRLLIERRAIVDRCRRADLPPSWSALRARAATASTATTNTVTTNAVTTNAVTNATANATAQATAQATAMSATTTAWLLTGLAQAAGHDLQNVSVADAVTLLDACAAFSKNERNRVLFFAAERAYRRRVLGGMVALQQRTRSRATTTTTTTTTKARPPAQLVFCIDEREESMRRALEEQDPAIETFGAAGFFGMAIDYRGLDDHAAAAYCPVVVTPAHEVHESPVFTDRRWHAVRTRLRSSWHAVERAVGGASRSLLGGAGASVLFGPFAGAISAGRVMAPRASLLAWKRVTSSLAPSPATRLSSLRQAGSTPVSAGASGAHERAKKPMGFSVDEAADRVTGLLKNIGLADNMARVVVVLGHGSTSLNNPHESAHDCGACGGRRGGANARLFADVANRVDVRAAVRARGVVIPDDTWFVGGLHDTADDGVSLSDLADVPASHIDDVERVVALLDAGRADSARERCRRFLDAPLGIDRERALAHVEARARHLGQPRPEYGHCTNASAVVGRRALTRGLHLDRRAFLISYDPSIDKDDAIAERILAAVGPVGAGINLEYWFSSVDNDVYGCGTKLPHNVTGLLGVMNGHQGDLRTGLPVQMVELHESLRLLLIVEASPETLLAIAGRQAEVRELVVNGWVQLVSVHPTTGAFMMFQGGAFVPFVPDADEPVPEVERSPDWHGQSREFVGPALIRSALAPTAGVAS